MVTDRSLDPSLLVGPEVPTTLRVSSTSRPTRTYEDQYDSRREETNNEPES